MLARFLYINVSSEVTSTGDPTGEMLKKKGEMLKKTTGSLPQVGGGYSRRAERSSSRD